MNPKWTLLEIYRISANANVNTGHIKLELVASTCTFRNPVQLGLCEYDSVFIYMT